MNQYFKNLTEEEIAELKKAHGEIVVIELKEKKEVIGRVCFRPLNNFAGYRDTMARYISADRKGQPFEAGEIVFNECYLDGLTNRNQVDSPYYAAIVMALYAEFDKVGVVTSFTKA